MAQKGSRKVSDAVRRQIVERYEIWRRNQPKRICADYGIARDTLRNYLADAREQPRRV